MDRRCIVVMVTVVLLAAGNLRAGIFDKLKRTAEGTANDALREELNRRQQQKPADQPSAESQQNATGSQESQLAQGAQPPQVAAPKPLKQVPSPWARTDWRRSKAELVSRKPLTGPAVASIKAMSDCRVSPDLSHIFALGAGDGLSGAVAVLDGQSVQYDRARLLVLHPEYRWAALEVMKGGKGSIVALDAAGGVREICTLVSPGYRAKASAGGVAVGSADAAGKAGVITAPHGTYTYPGGLVDPVGVDDDGNCYYRVEVRQPGMPFQQRWYRDDQMIFDPSNQRLGYQTAVAALTFSKRGGHWAIYLTWSSQRGSGGRQYTGVYADGKLLVASEYHLLASRVVFSSDYSQFAYVTIDRANATQTLMLNGNALCTLTDVAIGLPVFNEGGNLLLAAARGTNGFSLIANGHTSPTVEREILLDIRGETEDAIAYFAREQAEVLVMRGSRVAAKYLPNAQYAFSSDGNHVIGASPDGQYYMVDGNWMKIEKNPQYVLRQLLPGDGSGFTAVLSEASPGKAAMQGELLQFKLAPMEGQAQ